MAGPKNQLLTSPCHYDMTLGSHVETGWETFDTKASASRFDVNENSWQNCRSNKSRSGPSLTVHLPICAVEDIQDLTHGIWPAWPRKSVGKPSWKGTCLLKLNLSMPSWFHNAFHPFSSPFSPSATILWSHHEMLAKELAPESSQHPVVTCQWSPRLLILRQVLRKDRRQLRQSFGAWRFQLFQCVEGDPRGKPRFDINLNTFQSQIYESDINCHKLM